MRGHYIVIEGLEGAGKTTACNIVSNTLKDLGVKEIICTREPGGTCLSEKLRNLVLNRNLSTNEIINDKAETLIFYAARVQLVETIIKPALEKGIWVISDRHDLSTQAYQGGGRCIDKKMLTTLRDIALGNFYPELTIYLDVTPEIGLARVRARGDLNRIEQNSIAFFNRIRDRYLELAVRDNSIHTIDATQPLKVIICAIRKIIIRWFQERRV